MDEKQRKNNYLRDKIARVWAMKSKISMTTTNFILKIVFKFSGVGNSGPTVF